MASAVHVRVDTTAGAVLCPHRRRASAWCPGGTGGAHGGAGRPLRPHPRFGGRHRPAGRPVPLPWRGGTTATAAAEALCTAQTLTIELPFRTLSDTRAFVDNCLRRPASATRTSAQLNARLWCDETKGADVLIPFAGRSYVRSHGAWGPDAFTALAGEGPHGQLERLDVTSRHEPAAVTALVQLLAQLPVLREATLRFTGPVGDVLLLDVARTLRRTQCPDVRLHLRTATDVHPPGGLALLVCALRGVAAVEITVHHCYRYHGAVGVRGPLAELARELEAAGDTRGFPDRLVLRFECLATLNPVWQHPRRPDWIIQTFTLSAP